MQNWRLGHIFPSFTIVYTLNLLSLVVRGLINCVNLAFGQTLFSLRDVPQYRVLARGKTFFASCCRFGHAVLKLTYGSFFVKNEWLKFVV